MGFAFSKAFGPTDSVTASAKTTVGSTYVIPPGQYVIKKIRVGKGQVTNAEPAVGEIEVEITGVNGTYQYAYGNGSGAATNTHNIAAEEIECSIPAPGGGTVKVSVTDPDDAADVTVSLEFHTGSGPRIDSYGVGADGTDTTADTELEIGTIKVTRAGRIKQIRFAGSGIVDAKAGTGILEIKVPGLAGPFEFAVGNGPGGAATGGIAYADVIDVDIPVTENATLSICVTTAEVMIAPHCSIAVQ